VALEGCGARWGGTSDVNALDVRAAIAGRGCYEMYLVAAAAGGNFCTFAGLIFAAAEEELLENVA
jgi:hypothetical protein